MFSRAIERDPYPANIYLFKANNKNNRKRCKLCLKLTIKTPEQRRIFRSSEKLTSIPKSGVFIGNFEHISHLYLVILLLILNKQMSTG